MSRWHLAVVLIRKVLYSTTEIQEARFAYLFTTATEAAAGKVLADLTPDVLYNAFNPRKKFTVLDRH